MYFKLSHAIKKLNFTFPATNKVRIKADGISVLLRPSSEKERERFKGKDLIYCEAKVNKDAPEYVTNVLLRLLDKRMPEGFRKPPPESPIHPDLYPNVDEEGNIRPKSTPSISLFPDDFQEYYRQVLHELTDTIKNAVKVIRWRLNLRGAHYPTESTLGMLWSLNGRKWHKMPFDIIVDFAVELHPRFEGQQYEDAKELIRKQHYEPLAHELFLEAWELRSTNPRSSLIIGMAAAEVGIKQTIAALVPNTEWLVENVPSPPLTKLVKDYLVSLPTKLKIANGVVPPPSSIRGALHKGVELRNKTAHIGQAAPPKDDLESILLAVRDLLYLLDYYCGFKWSLSNVRPETLEEIKRENGL